MRSLLLCLFAVLLLSPARAAEPFFKKGDVIALVGGEDMVVASEYGYLELLLTRALPDYHLRFRNLAWEGDTVFEQRRDLNFPTWEEQLDKIGATVVICQFGQMESLMSLGREGSPSLPSNGERSASVPYPAGSAAATDAQARALAEFIAAYEKLIERFSGGGKRRIAILEPTPLGEQLMPDRYAQAAKRVAPDHVQRVLPMVMSSMHGPIFWTFRDGIHLDEAAHQRIASYLAPVLAREAAQTNERDLKAYWEALSWIRQPGKNQPIQTSRDDIGRPPIHPEVEFLRQLIIAKNRLWFDYWRPQNWAFLAGDRTAQPSSRDHLDPSKRWFPPEREAFLPLIEAKEKEIDALAAQLAAGNAGK